MNSLRKWFYRPRRDDPSLLAQFYYADEELNLVAGELDSFDGRKDPERCTALVNQLRQCQDKVLNICVEIMDELLPDERASRDFRIKFPDDVMQESLSGQLWFGAECLAAGSSILNRETESTRMRPLAKAVTKTIENVRNLLREQCLKPVPEYTEKIRESLRILDRLFADFELSYVSAMVPVKSVEEHEMQQNVIVLFSDTLQRSSRIGLVNQEQIDNYDPALMFTIPRLAIVSGLVIFTDGPLNLEKDSKHLSELFRPFKVLLHKIRELLWTMSAQELATLEKCLCSWEEPDSSIQNLNQDTQLPPDYYGDMPVTTDFVHKFYTSHPSCRQLTPELSSLCPSAKKVEKNERKRDRHSSKSSRTRARQERQSERFLSRLTGVEERPRAKRRSRRGSVQFRHCLHPQEHLQQTWPSVYQNPMASGGPLRNSGSRCSAHPNGRILRPNNHNYCNLSVDQSYDSSLPPNSRRNHRSRQACLSARNRRERINTIVCACGSSTSHLQDDDDEYRYRNNSHYGEGSADQQPVNAVDECMYQNPRLSIYSTAGYRTQCEFYDSSPYDSPQHTGNHSLLGYTSSSIDTRDEDIDEIQSSANMRNCISSAVIADPGILSVSSLYEPDNYSETHLSTYQNAIDPERMNSVTSNQVHYDDCPIPENFICDTVLDSQESQNSTVCQFKQPESPGISLAKSTNETDIKCDTCSCNIVSPVGDTHQEQMCSEYYCSELYISGDSHDTSATPVPGVRSIRTSFRPYAHQSSLETYSCNKSELVTDVTEKNDGPQIKICCRHEPSKEGHQVVCNPETPCNQVEGEEQYTSGSTSPHHSGTEDDEEVALALQAAEVAASWKARERYASSGDLIHRLFVCIAGVADQLQTNCASDLRKILKCVFLMNQTEEPVEENDVEIVEGKEDFPVRRETSNDDVTSSNGSEQLSVESAEDALIVIGTPEEVDDRVNSPDEMAELEEEGSIDQSMNDEEDHLLHSGSITVPPSVFSDHSLMQYSALSPPPLSLDHTYSLSVIDTHVDDEESDSESHSNEVTNNSVHDHEGLVAQLETVTEALDQISVREQDIPSIAAQLLAPVASVSPSAPSSMLVYHGQSGASEVQSYPLNSDNVSRRHPIVQEPPAWVPDHLAPRCMACGALFTIVRRRHHCRNCGKVFCGHCSRHSVPLPHFGIWKNVRVCNACFLYYVTSTADGSSALS